MSQTETHVPGVAVDLDEPAVAPRDVRRRRTAILAASAVIAAAALLISLLTTTGTAGRDSRVATAIDDEVRDAQTTSTTAAVAIVDGDIPIATTVAPSPSTTGAAPAPTTVPPAVVVEPTPSGPRTQVAVDPMGRWTLYFHEASRCAELVAGGRSHPKLLCAASAPSPAEVIGEVVTIDTSIGRVLLAAANPRVTTFSSFPREGGAFFHEGVVGSTPSVALAAGVIAPRWSDVIVRGGPHHLARIVVPPENRTFGRAELERVVEPPYGEWAQYRKVASTGFYMGGDQELGFYTGSDERPCLLYRRFGGLFENVIANRCLAASDGHLQSATIEDVGGPYMQGAFIVVAASDVVGTLTVRLPDGSTIGSLNPYADERSGFIAWGQPIAHVTVPDGVTTVDFVLMNNGTELARQTVTVPGR